MAGEPGTDPRNSVLETDGFPVSLFPYKMEPGSGVRPLFQSS